MRALNEGVDSPLGNMQQTFNGAPVPRGPVLAAVEALTAAVLAHRFSEWRYTNPVGRRQLEGLSEAQAPPPATPGADHRTSAAPPPRRAAAPCL